MPKYICTFKNFHNLKLWRIGDIYIGSAENLPKNKKGEMQFFRLLEGEPPEKPRTHIDVKVNEKVVGNEVITERPQKEASQKRNKAAEVRTCDICGIYQGTASKVNMHKITCAKRAAAEKAEQEKDNGVQ